MPLVALGTAMLELKKILTLLGAFSFGYNAAAALHELGHALALWTTGGDARDAIPMLQEFLCDEDDAVRSLSAWAIRAIDPSLEK